MRRCRDLPARYATIAVAGTDADAVDGATFVASITSALDVFFITAACLTSRDLSALDAAASSCLAASRSALLRRQLPDGSYRIVRRVRSSRASFSGSLATPARRRSQLGLREIADEGVAMLRGDLVG